ncbi:hypothetical protein G9A89_001529 [Geosiphon pyriformis]|nr:hypothetical protein G9A89_001529 [Geosiphon pyriformis]
MAPIAWPVLFGGKTWAQIAGGSSSHMVLLDAFGVSSTSSVNSLSMFFGSLDVSDLGSHLASLECSLELLADQVSGIMKRLSFVELVLLVPFSCASPPNVSVPVISVVESNMALNGELTLSTPSVSGADVSDAVLSSNGSKVLTSKMSGLESKMSALEALIGKLLVTVLGLYTGASSGTCFGQASKINSFIAKVVNTSTFIVLGGDFNENGSGRSMSFKFCLGLGLVNFFAGHHLAGTPTWCNSRGIEKTIDYIFVSENLSSAVAKHWIGPVSEFFDTNHSSVMVSAEASGDLDTMWAILERGMVDLADKVFARHWFSEFQCPRNKHFSKFFGLELLIAKIVSKIGSGDMLGVDHLVRKWFTLDKAKASAFSDLVILGGDSVVLLKHLSLVHKEYRRSKMFESRLAEETSIRKAIEKHIESFASSKSGIIRSILDWSFHKVVLDYLVINNDLVLEPEEIKSKVDKIMMGWTRVRTILQLLSER